MARHMMGDEAIPVLGHLLRRLQACHRVAIAENATTGLDPETSQLKAGDPCRVSGGVRYIPNLSYIIKILDDQTVSNGSRVYQ